MEKRGGGGGSLKGSQFCIFIVFLNRVGTIGHFQDASFVYNYQNSFR